ncbi:MAG: hypothetical protein EBX60_08660, partial [Betaproteobacteria bacterium]|nr:hypothetical protein [Betaproteobacteria bacterium]
MVHTKFHHTGDFLAKANTARAVDTAAHLFSRDQRKAEMSNWDDYISKRMLKHAGLLRESAHDADAENSRADLENLYSDLYKEDGRLRPSPDLSRFSDDQLQAKIDDLLARAARAREDQRWDRERAS